MILISNIEYMCVWVWPFFIIIIMIIIMVGKTCLSASRPVTTMRHVRMPSRSSPTFCTPRNLHVDSRLIIKDKTLCFFNFVVSKLDGNSHFLLIKIQEMEANVTVNCVHPGIVRTRLTREREGLLTGFYFYFFFKHILSLS